MKQHKGRRDRDRQPRALLPGANLASANVALAPLKGFDIEGPMGFGALVLRPYSAFVRTWDALGTAQNIVCHVAFCTPGPETRTVLRDGLGDLGKYVLELDSIVREINAGYRNQHVVFIDEEDVRRRIAPVNELIRRVKAFEARKDTDNALRDLQLYIRNELPAYVSGFEALNAATRRGAERDKVYEYIGELACQYPKPPRGKNYTIGLSIYRQLRSLSLRTALQNEALAELQSYISDDGSYVMEDARTDLGRYIVRAQEAYALRQSRSISNSTSSNYSMT
jgi:hypothetical protein